MQTELLLHSSLQVQRSELKFCSIKEPFVAEFELGNHEFDYGTENLKKDIENGSKAVKKTVDNLKDKF